MFSDDYREAITALANRCNYQPAATAFDTLPDIYQDALSHVPTTKILADVATLTSARFTGDDIDRIWRS